MAKSKGSSAFNSLQKYTRSRQLVGKNGFCLVIDPSGAVASTNDHRSPQGQWPTLVNSSMPCSLHWILCSFVAVLRAIFATGSKKKRSIPSVPRQSLDPQSSFPLLRHQNSGAIIILLTLSLPRVINFKFLLLPHQKYYITQYEELGFPLLTQIRDDHTTNSHLITYTFSLQEFGRMYCLGAKGLKSTHYGCRR